MQRTQDAQVVLTRELAHPVRRDRQVCRRLGRREERGVTVDDAATRSEEDTLDPAGGGGRESVGEPDQVDRRIERGLVHRDAHVDLCRLVNHHVKLPVGHGRECLRAADVGLDEPRVPGDLLSLAAREIIETRHRPSGREKRLGDM